MPVQRERRLSLPMGGRVRKALGGMYLRTPFQVHFPNGLPLSYSAGLGGGLWSHRGPLLAKASWKHGGNIFSLKIS